MTFGERLRKARYKTGMSQADVAKLADMEPSAISHYEKDRRRPSLENLRLLCHALNVSADYLVGFRELMTPCRS